MDNFCSATGECHLFNLAFNVKIQDKQAYVSANKDEQMLIHGDEMVSAVCSS